MHVSSAATAVRDVPRMAVPMIVSNTSVALLGMVDTAVIGHLDNPGYLAGVALAALLFDFVFWGLSFLRMGTTGTIAQTYGACDWLHARTALVQSLAVAAAIGAAVIALRAGIFAAGMALLDGSDLARVHAQRYYDIKIWSAPAVLGMLVIIGWLIGMQNSRTAMLLAIATNLVNVGLDLVLVVGMGLEVRGVAWAAVLATWMGLFTGLVLVRGVLRSYPVAPGWLRRLSCAGLRSLVALNANIMVRTLCLMGVFGFFTQQGARQGDVVLAGNALLLNFQMLMALGLDGFANATEALVGRAIGSGDRQAFHDTVRVAARWSAGIAGLYSMVYLVFGSALIEMLTTIEILRSTAQVYLPWMVVSPLISVWCFLLDGVFIGATRGREMRNSMLFSAVVVFLPCWFAWERLGNHGLWLAMMAFFAARGISMAWLFLHIERGAGFVVVRPPVPLAAVRHVPRAPRSG